MALGAHSLSPVELKAVMEAERRGEPFLMYRDGEGELRFASLAGCDDFAIGRVAGNDLALEWDPQVSRAHAQLQRVGLDWTLADDGLSRNGSHVNGERVVNRRRLSDGDVLRVGTTSLVFRAPGPRAMTTIAAAVTPMARLTDAERRVLVALCTPLIAGGASPVPATNREIAAELFISIDGVKTHVRSLFAKLGVEDLPQYQKRHELARRALESGLVGRADLTS